MTTSHKPSRPQASSQARLRASPRQSPFHIVLVTPEIPPNTGNIGRLCAATGAHLHLVEPLGFQIDEQAVRRAGLDYWHLVSLQTHPNLHEAMADISLLNPKAKFWFFTGKTSQSYLNAAFQPGDALVFGRESTGLPESVLQAHREQLLAIPTLGAVRSLNLANSVAITLYEALRQTGELEGAELSS